MRALNIDEMMVSIQIEGKYRDKKQKSLIKGFDSNTTTNIVFKDKAISLRKRAKRSTWRSLKPMSRLILNRKQKDVMFVKSLATLQEFSNIERT